MRFFLALCLALLTSGCIEEEGTDSNSNTAQQLANGLNFTNGTFVAPTPTPAPDTESPILTILGTEPMVVLQDSEWVDPGVIVRDNVDPDRIVYSTDTVDTSVPTIITVTYRATDAAGNVGNQVKRNVRILEADTTPPVITLIGNNPLIHTQGTPFSDPGALVTDNKDNDRNIAGLGTVDNNTLGTYTITYNAIDDAGNTATEVIRTVVVDSNLATNGGFEGNHTDTVINLFPGDTQLTGWAILGIEGQHSVAWHKGSLPDYGGYTPIDGDYMLIFNGSDTPPRGSISQSLSTDIGATYRIYMTTGRIGGTTRDLSITATANSGVGTLTSLVLQPSNVGWDIEKFIEFIATTGTTEIKFQDTSTETIGEDILLDGIRMEKVLP